MNDWNRLTSFQKFLYYLTLLFLNYPLRILSSSLLFIVAFIVSFFKPIRRRHPSKKFRPPSHILSDREIRSPPPPNPVRGSYYIQDFRIGNGKGEEGGIGGGGGKRDGTIRIISWNIERGFRIGEIIDTLRSLAADIILLQEVDRGCIRSGGIDGASEIGQALNMRVIQAVEMNDVNAEDENNLLKCLPCKKRKIRPINDNDDIGLDGMEGNALLTRFDFYDNSQPFNIHLPCGRNSSMPYHAYRKQHSAIGAVLSTPIGPIIISSVHFDAYSGHCKRWKQFEITVDAMKKLQEQYKNSAIIIGGDYNTHNHGIARLLHAFCGDDIYRWLSIGGCEGSLWNKKMKEKYLLTDAWNVEEDITSSKKIFGKWSLFKGKLDWIVYDEKIIQWKEKALIMKKASDHALLSIDITRKH